ncbi:GMC oxidoreductase [Aliterella atlantica]|uniref:Dehydrogenase n=1 Tax=Aliterella atlantica CENA595 TaxID=1618023 RepID=A0A0D8ZSF1_9CYAN|nr:GMC family oxidoreductase [Aliterella atlantica]KJH71683.1 dehydrogenase [Aliterella atlantica CENA595]
MVNEHYDVIIIGTGAGGGTLANALAPSGKKILLLERGNFLPKEKANWDSKEVYGKDRYRTKEVWYGKNGEAVNPFTHYYVGGNTKFYGSALYRLRERDFETVIHKEGISPEWALKYPDFAPYYDRAEKLYEVRGKRGLDPTEPPSSEDYPFPPISHEPHIEKIYYALKERGLHPCYQPLGVKLNEVDSFLSACIRCPTCDGFPCLLNAKADADVIGVRPAMSYNNVTLITEAKVLRLHTNASGNQVTSIEAQIAGESQFFSGDIVVLACGAINSAVLLLRSASDRHPHGLANSSDLVGRNYMRHRITAIVALSLQQNPTIYPKTLAVNDFYWGEKDFDYPMGHVQTLGNITEDRAAAKGPPFVPKEVYKAVASRTTGWFLMTEDLPEPHNRVRVSNNKIFLDYTNNNEIAYQRLIERWKEILKSMPPLAILMTTKMSLEDVGHQCGTCRFGEDPQTSVLDLNCRTHDVDNLYVVDGSFFPSSAALNPTLTIIANALRVAEHLWQRLQPTTKE